MGGHELMAALAAHLRGLGAPSGFTDRLLEDELLRVLIPITTEAFVTQGEG